MAVFNLAISGQIRQIAKLKLPPNFNSRYTVVTGMHCQKWFSKHALKLKLQGVRKLSQLKSELDRTPEVICGQLWLQGFMWLTSMLGTTTWKMLLAGWSSLTISSTVYR